MHCTSSERLLICLVAHICCRSGVQPLCVPRLARCLLSCGSLALQSCSSCFVGLAAAT